MAQHGHPEAFVPAQHDEPDAWHVHHTEEEGAPQEAHARIANPRAIFLGLAAMVIVLVGLLVLLTLYFDRFSTNLLAERNEIALSADYVVYRQKSDLELRTVAPLDAAQKSVRIPIDRAMDRVIEQYNALPRNTPR
jgi:hypothetical protein